MTTPKAGYALQYHVSVLGTNMVMAGMAEVESDAIYVPGARQIYIQRGVDAEKELMVIIWDLRKRAALYRLKELKHRRPSEKVDRLLNYLTQLPNPWENSCVA